MGKVKTTPPAYANMSTYSLAVFVDAKIISFSTKKAVLEAVVPASAGAPSFTIVVALTGTGLTRSGDDFTGGVITAIKRTVKGTDGAIEYSGFKIAATSLTKAAKSDTLTDDLKVWQAMFAGDDVMTGGQQTDRLQGYGGKDDLRGAAGNDWLMGGPGGDKLDGGAGFDGASYFNAAGKVTASLANPKANTGEAKGDRYVSIEKLEGSAFADKLTGNNGDNYIYGLAGNDRMAGLGGSDWLIGSKGVDAFDGGDGIDGVSYYDAAKGVTASLANAKANKGEAKGETFKSIEKLEGSNFADRLVGDAKSNSLFGLDGRDVLDGGAGIDFLYGGADRDTFRFGMDSAKGQQRNYDVIQDFDAADNERVDLSLIDAKSFVKGKQTFTPIGLSDFSGFGGEIRHVVRNDGIYIYGNVDKDKNVDFTIILAGIKVWEDDYLLLG
jgi:serralysin